MSEASRLRPLKAFVKRVEEGLDWEFRLADFDDRVRLQKLVFLARPFGWDHRYRYDIYHYGPYSPALARDYYDGAFASVAANDAPPSVDYSSFLELVGGRDREWLEVASTLKSIHDRYYESPDDPYEETDYEWIISRTAELKDVSEATAEGIYAELAAFDLVVAG